MKLKAVNNSKSFIKQTQRKSRHRIYFNSTNKTVINIKYSCNKYFQEILYKIDNWINEGSVWVIWIYEWRICKYIYLQSIIRMFIH